MNITHKSDYALRALLTLAAEQGHGPISITDLADRNQMPRPYLEGIMFEMRDQGWVKSIRGCKGGFALAMRPDEISMGQIVRYFDGPFAPTARAKIPVEHANEGSVTASFRKLLSEIRTYSFERLDKATLATLAPTSVGERQARC